MTAEDVLLARADAMVAQARREEAAARASAEAAAAAAAEARAAATAAEAALTAAASEEAAVRAVDAALRAGVAAWRLAPGQTDPRDPELVQAVEKGASVSKVRQLLLDGADVNALDSTGEPAVYIALLNSDRELVALLLRFNANITHVDSDGDNLLVCAITSEHPNADIVADLLCAGMPVDQRAVEVAKVELKWSKPGLRRERKDILDLLMAWQHERTMELAFQRLRFVR